jgi:ATP-dependent protease Clp ATPase subunit
MSRINRIRDEKENISIDTKEILDIIKEYFKNLYSIMLENLTKMEKLIDSSKPLKLNQEEINN